MFSQKVFRRNGSESLQVTSRLMRALAAPENPPSIAGKARKRRQDEMSRRVPHLSEMRVIDTGGWPTFWRAAETKPTHVTMINLQLTECSETWMDMRIGDACDPHLKETFDLVVSNSLLEHVGGHWRPQQLADVVHRLSGPSLGANALPILSR